MGSVGVYTGRLTGTQFGSFLSDKKTGTRFGNITSGNGRYSTGRFPDRIVVRNEDDTSSYTINFSKIRLPSKFRNAGKARRRLEKEKIKDAYLRALRKSAGNFDNAQSTYDRVYAEARAQGMTEKQAINKAQRARTAVAKQAASDVAKLDRFRRNGIKVSSRRKLPSVDEVKKKR